ncbi:MULTISPECIES: OprO/OprP family phosphate-selective porin [Phenylobacterium]|uniref:Phosphate-selective porin OprO/OprP n=1 Tax=Phenylobacterium koreense TaxID=266125 RepID=A0ABV2EEC0_9CAUL
MCAVAGGLAVAWAGPAGAQALSWDSGELVSQDGGFAIRPKGRLVLDGYSTTGSAHDARNASGREWRTLRAGLAGRSGKHLIYNVEADFQGGETVLRSTYLVWRDEWDGRELEFTLGNRLSERGLEGSSSSEGTAFMERNSVALAAAPVKGFYGWGGIAKIYGAGWHLAGEVAGEDPANREATRDTTTYLLRGHWNPVRSETGLVHLGAWAFYEDLGERKSLSRNTNWAGHFNDQVQVALGAIADPVHGQGYGLELGGVRGRGWSFVEAGRREIDARSLHADVDAWSLSAGWSLTGEPSAYSSRSGTFVKTAPARPVSKGGFGGWDVAIRYQVLDNTDAPLGGLGREAEVGVNWRLEQWMRLMVDLSHWEVERPDGPYAGADRGDSLAGRLQLTF